jgi:GT2 family glycosyltransferase
MNTRGPQDGPAALVSRLRDELNALEVRAAVAEQRHRELLEATEDLRAACSQAEGRADEYLRQAAASDGALQEREARLAALDEERAHTRAELTELRAHLLRTTSELGAAQGGLKLSAEVRADLQARLAGLDEERTRIRSELGAAQAGLRLSEEVQADLQARLDAARGEAEQLARTRREAETARAQHEAELAQVRGEGEARRLEQQALLTRAQQEHQAEIARVRQQAGALEQTIAGLQATLKAQEADLQRLQRIVARARDYVELIERSERWRLGGMLTRLGGRLLRRKAKPDAVVQLLRLLPTRGSMAPRPAVAPAPLPRVRSVPPPGAAVSARAKPLAVPPGPPAPILRPLEQMPGTAAPPTMPEGVSADVVVCVHDALEDARACLESVIARTDHGYSLIVVDDGSGPETASFLQGFAEQHEHIRLIRDQSALGYTCAANQGLHSSEADWVILLNSDTIVTTGWLARLLECGESDPKTGIVGPVSNSATWQSVPKLIEDGTWADNPLPYWTTVEDMGKLVAQCSDRKFPEFPLPSGFCLAVRRAVIERIGYFDEEKYPRGYGEENDYAFRAAKAGFTLRLADHCYVYHAGSRSFTPEGRLELIHQNRPALVADWGEAIARAQDQTQEDDTLDGLRRRLGEWIYQLGLARNGTPLSVLYLLPHITDGTAGGAHMVVDAVAAMRALGIKAHVAIQGDCQPLFYATYPAHLDCFAGHEDDAELARQARTYDLLVATHFRTVRLAQRLRGPDQAVGYFIQDYEPRLAHTDEEKAEAFESYALIPDIVPFAMTGWIGDTVAENTGVTVHRVEPAFHQQLFRSAEKPSGGPVTVCAMVRPRTPRRGPERTLRVLRRLKEQFGSGVRIVAFGCAPEHPLLHSELADFQFEAQGILSRADAAKLMCESDVFIDASDYQAYGLTAVEAMSCGCVPVVPLAGGALTYAVNNRNALIVDTTDDNALLAAARSLISDRELRQRLARNGRRTARRLSIRKLAASTYLLLLRAYAERFADSPSATARLDAARNNSAWVGAELPFPFPAEIAPVSIVVPAYNAPDELAQCLESIERCTRLPHRLIVIDDASTDPRVQQVLDRFGGREHVEVLRNESNLGFVATANRGIELARGDVVLLNSDVVVFEGWLEGIREVAWSHPYVASVTPLSNTGAFTFVPRDEVAETLAHWPDLATVAQRVRSLSLRRRPETPTAIGYCMYLRRSAIDRVGLFDEKAFGRGYGEENDWCCRALEQGFLNLLDDATFIYHAEAASFSLAEKAQQVDAHLAVVKQRYPYYQELIDAFRAGPLKEIQQYYRCRLAYHPAARPDAAPPVVLRAAHVGGGGSFEQLAVLSQRLHVSFATFLLEAHNRFIPMGPETPFLRLSSLTGPPASPIAFNLPLIHRQQSLFKRFDPGAARTYGQILDTLGVRLLHVHHFIGHYLDLVQEACRRNIPFVVTVHDYYTICPKFDLVNHEGRFCGICDAGEQSTLCLRHPHLHGFAGGGTNVLRPWREYIAKALAAAAKVVCPSGAARDLVAQAYPFLAPAKLLVIEHGAWDDYEQPVPRSGSRHDPAAQLRVAYVGDLAPRKGMARFLDLARAASGESIELHHYGSIYGGERAVADFSDRVVFHGSYQRRKIVAQLVADEIDLGLFPGIWPETYCHALTECVLAGVPVIATDIGAVAERVKADDLGWIVPLDAGPADLIWLMKQVQMSDELLSSKTARVKQIKLKTVGETAQQYAALYRDVLSASATATAAAEANTRLSPEEFLRAMRMAEELGL